ncbi:restriction endonuclease subunit S [Butyrivibrio sp. VCB2001]|uniref:restriction endonuclease subunit S n=1 Tax=Butyrivibrio sp. VCB2001 TaxID=1280667 RepID=UPI00042A3FC5|nr:restriction endonuclease subunit S [Butyrivibrio sp. VCB2001]
MDTKALRQKILDLAIRGKLVPQDPNDEPASVLLERIREEKKRMVKEGKLKAKDIKNDTIIFKGEDNLHYEKFQDGTIKCIEDEIPFELPEGWEWTRLSSIASIVTGSLDANAQTENGNYPFFTCGEDVLQTDSFAFDCDAILLGGNNAVGDFKMHRYNGRFNAYQRVYVITTYQDMNTDYLYYHTQYYLKHLQKISIGTQTRYLKLGMIQDLLISIPPKSMQSAIENRLRELLSNICVIDITNSELIDDISNTKSKILNLAISGKLVPQNPSDEPASVLLERIRKEKEVLIKQGKLKRDKKESVIYKGDDNSYYEKLSDGTVMNIDDELPFEISDTWCWSRLSSLCIKEIKRGKAPKYVDKSNTLVFAQKCNLKKGGIDYTLSQYLDETTISRYDDSEYLQKHDTVINSTGTGTLGRVGFIDSLAECPIVPDSHVTTIRVSSEINQFYVFVLLKSLQSVLEKSGEGSTNQKELKPNTLQDILVPIPPMEEQKKICNAVHNSYNLIKKIEDSIN